LEKVCGLKENPLQMVWASGEPKASSKEPKATISKTVETPLERGDDYEAVTLMRLRQAQERKSATEAVETKDNI
jgi:hypothetical protein